MAAKFHASEELKKIHYVIQESGLHYVINQTPFSSYISIRKKLINPHSRVTESTVESTSKIELEVLEKKVKIIEDEKGELEELCALKEEEALVGEHDIKNKLSNLHAFADKLSGEKEKYKEEISQLKEELAETKIKLSKSNKLVKTNEKEIHNLTKNVENCQDTIKGLKSDKAIIKAEKVKAENDLKKIVKKSTKTAKKKSMETQTVDLGPKNPLAVTYMSPICSSCNSQPSSKLMNFVDEEGNEPNEKSSSEDFLSGSKLDECETDEEAVAVPNIEVGNFFSTLSRDVKASGSNSISNCLNSTTRDSSCIDISNRDCTHLDSTSRDFICSNSTTSLDKIGLVEKVEEVVTKKVTQTSNSSSGKLWKCDFCDQTFPMGYTYDQVSHMAMQHKKGYQTVFRENDL